MKKRLAKILALALCAILLVTGSVFVTLALLQDQSNTIRNTFTSADIRITLHEGKLADDGFTVDSADRVTEQTNKYHLVPGKSYIKDPRITIEANSEQCYIFFAVKNTMLPEDNTIEPATVTNGYTRFNEQCMSNGWWPLGEPLPDSTYSATYKLSEAVLNQTNGWKDGEYTIYFHQSIIQNHTTDQTVNIYDTFTLKNDLTDQIKTWQDQDGDGIQEDGEEFVIEIIAFAVQTQGFIDNGKEYGVNVGDAFVAAGFGVKESTQPGESNN